MNAPENDDHQRISVCEQIDEVGLKKKMERTSEWVEKNGEFILYVYFK